MFKHCVDCDHIEEDHAIDAPEGEQECMWRDEDTDEPCTCVNFEESL